MHKKRLGMICRTSGISQSGFLRLSWSRMVGMVQLADAVGIGVLLVLGKADEGFPLVSARDGIRA